MSPRRNSAATWSKHLPGMLLGLLLLASGGCRATAPLPAPTNGPVAMPAAAATAVERALAEAPAPTATPATPAISPTATAEPTPTSAPRPTGGTIDLRREFAVDFLKGTLTDVEAVDGGSAVALAKKDDGVYAAQGEVVSPPYRTAVRFDDLVLSWNGSAPAGTTLALFARVEAGGEWSPWHPTASWRDGRGTGPDSVKVGELGLKRPAEAWQYRVVLTTSNAQQTPRLRSIAVVAADLSRPPAGPPVAPAAGWARDLPVPAESQAIQDPAVAWEICSPTSLAMVLRYWGVQTTLPRVYEGVRDVKTGLYGNWPLNTAYAGELGFDSYVARMYSLAEVKEEIAAGRPVIISIEYEQGELPGAPLARTSGHLIVVRGFTPEGDVIVNDPAAPSRASVRRVLRASDLERVWMRHGGAAYLIAPLAARDAERVPAPPQPTPRPAALPERSPAALGMRDEPIAAVEDLMRKSMDDGLFPGAVVLLARKGVIVKRQAYGYAALYADREQRLAIPVPATIETIFDLASLSKLFTAAAVMKLVEGGAIDRDAPVARYIPEFAANGKERVTVKHLLTHAGGLPAGVGQLADSDGLAVVLERAYQSRPRFPPGSGRLYSDVGFITLGKLVERVSGVPLDRYVAAQITGPLGMVDTMYRPPSTLLPRIAATEFSVTRGMIRGAVHDPVAYRMDGVAGHAGVFGTAGDLAVFAQMMLNGGEYDGRRILAPESVAAMTKRQVPASFGDDVGLGWELNQSRYMGGLRSPFTFGHTGYTGTFIVVDPRQEAMMVLLTNRVHPAAKTRVDSTSRQLADLVAISLRGGPQE